MTTSSQRISELAHGKDNYCIISTYQSLEAIQGLNFDIAVCDEAHRCCSAKKSYYTRPTEESFPANEIVYLTATPKIFYGNEDTERVVSMDNEDIFGPRYSYSFRQAIEDGVISDYQIVTGHTTISEEAAYDDIEYNSLFLSKAI
jgi:predicted helicase